MVDEIKQVNESTESSGNQPFQQNRVYDESGIVPALPSQMSCGTHAIALDLKTVGGTSKTRRGGISEDCSTLDTDSYKGVLAGCRIRRLTEIECERLQGYADNHTELGNYDGVLKKISKTQRYKMIGNAVSVPIVKMIGLKLKRIVLSPNV